MNVFRHKPLHFSKPDPLANGLGDEIAAEQKEADAFRTLDDISADELSQHWNAIIKDVEKDKDWFSFAKD